MDKGKVPSLAKHSANFSSELDSISDKTTGYTSTETTGDAKYKTMFDLMRILLREKMSLFKKPCYLRITFCKFARIKCLNVFLS